MKAETPMTHPQAAGGAAALRRSTTAHLANLCGVLEPENLRQIETALDVTIAPRRALQHSRRTDGAGDRLPKRCSISTSREACCRSMNRSST